MKRRLLSSLVLVSISIVAFGVATPYTATQYNAWYAYQGNHKLYKNFSLRTEFHFRRSGLIAHPMQDLVRGGIEWKKKTYHTTLGYDFVNAHQYGELPAKYPLIEHRSWEQFAIDTKWKKCKIQNRVRIEQRYREVKVKDLYGNWVHDHYGLLHRVRYRFQIAVPLNKIAKTEHAIYAVLHDEFFLGVSESFSKTVFDQNRLTLTIDYSIRKGFDLVLGYMNQYAAKSGFSGSLFENNHTLITALRYNLDLRPAKA